MDDETFTCVSIENENIVFKEEFKNLASTIFDALEDNEERIVSGLEVSTAVYTMMKEYLESCDYKPNTYEWYG